MEKCEAKRLAQAYAKFENWDVETSDDLLIRGDDSYLSISLITSPDYSYYVILVNGQQVITKKKTEFCDGVRNDHGVFEGYIYIATITHTYEMVDGRLNLDVYTSEFSGHTNKGYDNLSDFHHFTSYDVPEDFRLFSEDIAKLGVNKQIKKSL